MLQTLNARQNLTPALCRGARGVLGWTIEEFANTAGVSVSTVVSFESGQRAPMAANLGAMALAFSNAGVVFTGKAGADGRGFKITKSAEALRDVLMIGALKASNKERLNKMEARVERYQTESKEFHESIPGRRSDVSGHVRSDLDTLRNAVDREIERHRLLRLDDQGVRFLESVMDYLLDRQE